MIYIDSQLCDGCGICVNTCPTDAIILRGNIAVIEQSLCEECQVCMDKCPRGAILLIEQLNSVEEQPLSTIPASRVEVLPPEPKLKPVSAPLGVAVGAAIVEVLPRLASLAMEWLEHRPRAIETSAQNVNPIPSLDPNTSQRGTGRGQGQGRGRGQGRGQGKRRRQRRNRR